MIRIEFDTDNAAFEDFPRESARILRNAADRIESGAMIGPLHDLNGNKVGYFEVLPSKKLRRHAQWTGDSPEPQN
jgi:hypothetical protein